MKTPAGSGLSAAETAQFDVRNISPALKYFNNFNKHIFKTLLCDCLKSPVMSLCYVLAEHPNRCSTVTSEAQVMSVSRVFPLFGLAQNQRPRPLARAAH